MADKGDQEKLLKGKKEGSDPQEESREEPTGGCPERYEGIGNKGD